MKKKCSVSLVMLRVALLWFAIHCSASRYKAMRAYDTRDAWGACIAFSPENQGDCNACAASSLASSLGIRACIRDRRNIRFSSQRVWDCFLGSCEKGVNIENFMFAIMYSDESANMLALTNQSNNRTLPSNSSACVANTPTKNERIETISYHKEWWLGLLSTDPQERKPSNFSTSVYNMQREIFENGPIVSILYLTPSEMTFFSQWKNTWDVLPSSSTNPSEYRNQLHAVTVIGWGVQEEFKTFYWIILNSFGDKWGKKGVGKIPGGFGLVEHEWYSISSSQVPCTSACFRPSLSLPLPPSKIEDPKSQKEDEMIIVPLPKKQDELEAVSVLGITILGMALLSMIICTLHNNNKPPKKTFYDIHYAMST